MKKKKKYSAYLPKTIQCNIQCLSHKLLLKKLLCTKIPVDSGLQYQKEDQFFGGIASQKTEKK